MIVFKLPGGRRGAFCYIAAYSRRVNLGFYRGAELPDPHHVLPGTGKQMRPIRFDSLDDLRRPHVRGYIRSAMELVGATLRTNSRKNKRRQGDESRGEHKSFAMAIL